MRRFAAFNLLGKMITFYEKLLNFYQLKEEDFLKLSQDYTQDDLPDFNQFSELFLFKERIYLAKERNEKILIYGDYDCDGMMGVAILAKTFEQLGNLDYLTYIPSRQKDGYGLTINKVEEYHRKGVKLIITVDNGISCYDAIKRANELGIDVLLSDHHEVPKIIPKAYAIFHSLITKIDEYNPSGAFVSLMISAALLGYYDKYLITLASLSIVSDLMIVKGYNRILLKLGITYLNQYRYPNLINLLSDKNSLIDEITYGYEIVPKINALGRLYDGDKLNLIVAYLLKSNQEIIDSFSLFINQVNEERKTLTQAGFNLLAEVSDKDKPAICEILNVQEGLLGLIANKAMNAYLKPTVIFTYEEDQSTLKGSMRSKEGFDVYEFLSLNTDIIIKSGGHTNAGGLSLKAENYLEFNHRFNEYANTHPFTNIEKPFIEISLSDINRQNYDIIAKFKPFGEGLTPPTFKINHLLTKELTFIKDGQHILTNLSLSAKLVGWNINKKDVLLYKYIDIYGVYELNKFRQQETINFKIIDYKLY